MTRKTVKLSGHYSSSTDELKIDRNPEQFINVPQTITDRNSYPDIDVELSFSSGCDVETIRRKYPSEKLSDYIDESSRNPVQTTPNDRTKRFDRLGLFRFVSSEDICQPKLGLEDLALLLLVRSVHPVGSNRFENQRRG